MFKLKECVNYPGFFVIPTYQTYGINLNGIVINLLTEEFPNISYSDTHYSSVSLFGNTKSIHRLLATTFIDPNGLDITTLKVNHIDGVKTNNDISNLEWVTRSGNCLHAYKTGLKKDKPYHGWSFKFTDDLSLLTDNDVIRKNKTWERKKQLPNPILVTDLTTKISRRFNSSEEYATLEGVCKNTFQKAIWRTKGIWKNCLIEYLDKTT